MGDYADQHGVGRNMTPHELMREGERRATRSPAFAAERETYLRQEEAHALIAATERRVVLECIPDVCVACDEPGRAAPYLGRQDRYWHHEGLSCTASRLWHRLRRLEAGGDRDDHDHEPEEEE